MYPRREKSSLRRLNFNKSGHNSFNTWRAKAGGGGGGGVVVVVSINCNKTVTSLARVLENVNRELNAQ